MLTVASVNPLYYVTFTTCTLVASFILFRGFNTTDVVNTISLLCGFLTIFTGVYLLNLSREDPNGEHLGIRSADNRGKYHEVDGIPTDGLTGLQTRLSMSARRSGEVDDEHHRRSNSWSLRSPVSGRNPYASRHDSQNLIHNYDVEAGELDELADDSDDFHPPGRKRTSFEDANGSRIHANGVAGSSSHHAPNAKHATRKTTVLAGNKGFQR